MDDKDIQMMDVNTRYTENNAQAKGCPILSKASRQICSTVSQYLLFPHLSFREFCFVFMKVYTDNNYSIHDIT